MCDKNPGTTPASLLFYSCANRCYEDFVPLYAYFALRSTPGAIAEFGLENSAIFRRENSKNLEFLNNRFGKNRVNLFDVDWSDSANQPILPNSVRFINQPHSRARYVYVGDIDIVILDENLFMSHLRFMERRRLRYSNSVRPDTLRMSGLHFSEFDALYPLPDISDLEWRTMNDECLLYEIVRRRGHIIQDAEWFRPVHGIHISPNRTPNRILDDTGRTVRPGWGIEPYASAWRQARIEDGFAAFIRTLSTRVQDCLAKIDAVVDALSADCIMGHVPRTKAAAFEAPCSDTTEASRITEAAYDPLNFKSARTRLLSERRFAEALALEESALLQRPADVDLWRQRAWTLGAMGRRQEARATLERALLIAPEHPVALQQLVSLLTHLGGQDQAETVRHRLAAALAKEKNNNEIRKASLARRMVDLLRICGRRWPSTRAPADVKMILDMLLAFQSDDDPQWILSARKPLPAGTVVDFREFGRFMVGDSRQTVHKRLSREIPWELPIAVFLRELAKYCPPDSLLVDIGAHLGSHSIAMAKAFPGTVLSFEPVLETFDQLRRNIELNGLDNIRAIQAACSEMSGLGQMVNIDPGNPGVAMLKPGNGAATIVRLDDIFSAESRPLSILRMDIEGHEPRACLGAQLTIQRDKPIIIAEILTGSRDLHDVLVPWGYEGICLHRSDWVFYPKELKA